MRRRRPRSGAANRGGALSVHRIIDKHFAKDKGKGYETQSLAVKLGVDRHDHCPAQRAAHPGVDELKAVSEQ